MEENICQNLEGLYPNYTNNEKSLETFLQTNKLFVTSNRISFYHLSPLLFHHPVLLKSQ